MAIDRVTVIGGGTMGNGIAQVAAHAGYRVTLVDTSGEALVKAMRAIDASLTRLVDKGRLPVGAREAAIGRLETTSRLENSVLEADLVIEAVYENLELKQKIFRQVEHLARPQAILASNTSSLPITALAAVTSRPDRFLGLHFMNPVPLMKGVEVIAGRLTSEDAMAEAIRFVESLGKVPTRAVDYAGFIASRVLDVMLNEAVCCVMDGNRPEDVDTAMKVCCNFPMGPLELIDLAGADVLLNVMETMEREFGDKYRPAPLLRQMVRAGQLGRKSGRGFYEYEEK